MVDYPEVFINKKVWKKIILVKNLEICRKPPRPVSGGFHRFPENPSLTDHTVITYSKALRCTFLGEWKNLCSSKFVQLELLNKAKARALKNVQLKGSHYINSFISNFLGPNALGLVCLGPRKICISEVCAAWCRVSRGLTVCTSLFLQLYNLFISKLFQLKIMQSTLIKLNGL